MKSKQIYIIQNRFKIRKKIVQLMKFQIVLCSHLTPPQVHSHLHPLSPLGLSGFPSGFVANSVVWVVVPSIFQLKISVCPLMDGNGV